MKIKFFLRKFQKVVSITLGLTIVASIVFTPFYGVHAEEDTASEDMIEALTTVMDSEAVVIESSAADEIISGDEVIAPVESKSEDAKKSLEKKLGNVAGNLFSGMTALTLQDCGKRLAGFVGIFSESYGAFKKEQEKKAAASARSSASSSSERVHSSDLP